MTFVGRAHELVTLDRLLDPAARGAAWVVLRGPPGIGKTTLAAFAAERARRRGLRVALGRCSEWGGAPPYWIWRQFVDALGGQVPSALAVLFDGGGERLGASHRVSAFQSLVSLFREAAMRGPMMFVLDDLHDADVPSLLALGFVLRSTRDAPIAWLATLRDSEVTPRPGPEGHLAPGPSKSGSATELRELLRLALEVTVGGLDAPALRVLLEQVGAASDEVTLDNLMRLTRGHPLHVEGVIALAAATGRLGSLGTATVPIPSSMRATIVSRIMSLDPAARGLCDALAVLGGAASPARCRDLVARADRSPGPDLALAVAGVLDRGLIEGASTSALRFQHDVIREVAHSLVTPERRATLHRAAAELLEERHSRDSEDGAADVARHWREGGESARALPWSLAAARAAMRRLAFEDAIAELERAAGDEPGGADLARLELALGEARLAAGAMTRGREALLRAARAAAAVGEVALEGRAALLLARTIEFGAYDPEVIELLAMAAERAHRVDEPLQLRLVASRAAALWSLPGAAAERADRSRRALERARELGDEGLLIHTLTCRLLAIAGPMSSDERAALTDELAAAALRSGDDDAQLEAHRWAVNLALERGDLARFSAEVEGYGAIARRLARPDLMVAANLRRIFVHILAGRLDDALTLARATCLEQERLGDPQAQMGYRCAAAFVHDLRDDSEALAALLPDLTQDYLRLGHIAFLGPLVAFAHARVGRHDEARALIERIGRNDFADVPEDLSRCTALALLAEALFILADDRRGGLLEPYLAAHERRHASTGGTLSRGSMHRPLGLLAELRGDRAAARAHHLAALESHRAGGMPLLVTRSLEDLARVDGGAAALERATPTGGERPERRARLEREGAAWAVAFGERVFRVRAGKGVALLATLLASPGVEHPAVTLAGRGPESLSGEDELVDGEARRQVSREVARLREAMGEARELGQVERAEALEEKLRAVKEAFAKSLGLGGRSRRSTGAAERARVSVTRALRRTIEELGRHDGELGVYLDRVIRTGALCAFVPDPLVPVRWRVSFG